jgi:acetyl esterase
VKSRVVATARFSAVCLVLAASACGATGDAPTAKLHRDLEYGRAGDVPLLFDAHVPEWEGSFPVAILDHGGGWTRGDKADDIAPQHRWPACRDDVLTAIRWAKTHAAEFKGDAARIALIGYPAGGHLVRSAATVVDDTVRVQAVVNLAGPTDFVQELPKRGDILGVAQRGLLNRPQELTPESVGLLHAISPVDQLRPGLPPFLIMHGDADRSVPCEQSVTFQAKLRKPGVRCDLITLSGTPHNLTTWDEFTPDHSARLIAWLREVLVVPMPATPPLS